MPLIETKGAASAQGFGEFAQASTVANYIEDVFSTYLYKGNASTQTITNGIDLAVKGGLVWTKSRTNANEALIYDTVRGVNNYIIPSSNQAAQTSSGTLTAFNSNGFTLGANDNSNDSSTENSVSWSIAKSPKFFDVLTYTGNGTAGTAISHSLGSTPGFILVKRTDTGGSTGQNWVVWHRSAGGTGYFNSTNALDSSFPNSIFWGNGSSYVAPTSTTFTVTDSQNVNASGGSYVAYLFAHNAGGFGLTGTDNVISCGSFSLDSAVGVDVNLGYEAQWVLIKRTDSSAGSSGWYLLDTMRGWTVDATFGDKYLVANTTAAEAGQNIGRPTATGFAIQASTWLSTGSYIYIAIRRGPMKVPTSGTSVFYSAGFSDNSSSFSTGFVTDFAINKVTYYNPDAGLYTTGSNYMTPRLVGTNPLQTNSTAAEGGGQYPTGWDIQDGYKWSNGSGYDIFGWAFQRAPSFADVVCYTGNGTSGATQNHNLGVVPELVILKCRSAVQEWRVMSAYYNGGVSPWSYRMALNTTGGVSAGSGVFNDTAPTASVFTLGNNAEVNDNGSTYVAYLFATCAGVSKVGSYSGTGSTQTIDCGFASGARFVLIKRTNTTGAWYVYDSSRGIQSGNDPYLLWNDSAAAVTNTNYVDAAATGFQVVGSSLNTSGSTYIFLAIA